MANFEIHKTRNYVVMGNYHLKDSKLTLKAKGLLSVMFSLPENWDYSINGLKQICQECDTALKSALKELKENGYLYIEKIMPNNTESGKIEYVYHIYEQPQKQEGGFQPLENQPLENHTLDNITNNNITNKDKNIYINKGVHTCEDINNNNLIDNNTSNEEQPVFSGFTSNMDFLPTIPTLQEIKDYCRLKSYTFNAEVFYNYYEGLGWKMNGRFIENWQAVANNWQLKEELNNRYSAIRQPILTHAYTKNDLGNAFGGGVNDDEI